MPAFLPTRRAKLAVDNALTVNQSKSLEEEFEALTAELTLADSKLSELNDAFHGRDLRSTPLPTFQELSAQISQQQLIVDRLRERFTEVEFRLGEKRRVDAATHDRNQLISRQIELTDRLSSIDTKVAKSLALIQAMKTQIDFLLAEKNAVLQELATLKQQLGENRVN